MYRSRFLHSLPFLEPTQNPLRAIPAAQAPALAQQHDNDHPHPDPEESNTHTHTHTHTIKRDNRSTDIRTTPSTTATTTMTQHVSCGNVVSLEPIAHPSGQCVGPCFFVPPANIESTDADVLLFDEALCPFRAVIGPAVAVAAPLGTCNHGMKATAAAATAGPHDCDKGDHGMANSNVNANATINAKPPACASPHQSSASTTMSTSPALLQSCQKATSSKSATNVDATDMNLTGTGACSANNLNLYFGFANVFGTNHHLDGNGNADGNADVHCNWKNMDNDMDIEHGNPRSQEVEFFRVRLDLLRSIHVESSTSSSSSSINNSSGGTGAQQNQEEEHDANDANNTRHNHSGTIPPSLVFQFDSCMLRTFFHPASTSTGTRTTSSVNTKDETQLQNAFHQMKSFLQTNRNETNKNSSIRIVHEHEHDADHDVIATGDTNHEMNVGVPTTLRKRIRDLNQQPSQLIILSKRMRHVQSDVLFHHHSTTTMLKSLSDSNANDCIYNKCANELQELNQISHDSNANVMEESMRKCRSEQATLELELDSILQGLFPSQGTRRRGRERQRRRSRATTCTGSDDGGGSSSSSSNRLLNGTSVTPSTNETGGKAAPVSTLDLEKESSTTNTSTSTKQATQKLGQGDGSFNSDRITRVEECIRLYRRAIIEKHDIACLSLR